jgi:hypothetical protein
MLPLAHKLLSAAGFEYDATERTWMVPVPLPLLVTVECFDGGDLMDAILEVHAVLEANGCTYSNFSINGRYVSLVGLTAGRLVAVA